MSPGPTRVALLGATGSIGTQTLDVLPSLRAEGHRIELVALAAGRRVAELAQQACATGARWVAVAGPEEAQRISELLPAGVHVLSGPEGLEKLASLPEVDLVLNAVVGAAGLRATLAALAAGKTLALANKESLVVGGRLVMGACVRQGQIIPVDSEHAALYQALQGVRTGEIARLWITASGGAFRDLPPDRLAQVTPEQALAHPTWRMGPRITVDSATLVNKAFEMIEAHHLFGVDWDRIEAVLHPQSIVHGLVELVDGTMLAQMAPADMRIPIRYALTHPARAAVPPARLELPGTRLAFTELPRDGYPGYWAVLEAGRRGGTAPAVANAADEVLVAAFLEGRLPFTGIAEGIAEVLGRHEVRPVVRVEELEAADRWGRAAAGRFVESGAWRS